jgi:cytochrome c553
MKKIIAFAAGAMLATAAGTALAQSHGEQAARALAKDVCSACHGPEGHSISPVFPRLAGQQAGYIIVQLEAFRNHTRGDPNAQAYMWGMSSQLTDATIKDLAQYYSTQKPVNGEPGDPALMAEGKKIYVEGIPSQNVPPCESCHGPDAKGTGAFPRLAGQHVEYLIAQLQGFQSGTRSNAPIMQNVVRTMTPEQLKAAATYAASK